MRDAARMGVVLSGLMFAGNVAAALPGSGATTGLVISPTRGDSATPISLQIVPSDRSCPLAADGTGARWSTFMAPAAYDPGSVRHGPYGPFTTGPVVPVMPLHRDDDGQPIVHVATAADGKIEPAPMIGFRGLAPGELTSGTYRIGFVCTRTLAPSETSTPDRFWWLTITVEADPTGGPAGFVWAVGDADPTPTAGPMSLEGTASGGGPSGGAPARTQRPMTRQEAVTGIASPSAGVDQRVMIVVPGPTTTTTSTTTTAVVVAAGPTTVATTAPTVPAGSVGSAGATTTTTTASASPGGSSGGRPPATGAGGTGGSGGAVGSGSGSRSPFPTTGADVAGILLWGLALVAFGRVATLAARPAARTANRTAD